MYCRCIYIFFMYCMYLYICMYCRYLHVLHVTEYTEGITIYVYYRYICHCDLARVHLLQKACWVYSTLGVTTECIYCTFCTGSDYATCRVGWRLYVQHIHTCLSNNILQVWLETCSLYFFWAGRNSRTPSTRKQYLQD